MALSKAEGLIRSWMENYEKAEDYELHRTEFVKEGQDWYLRVFVDKRDPSGEDGYGYLSTEDCEAISRYLSEKLDDADPIKQNYFLEVSSPGMDRPLLSDRDLQRFRGHEIEIKLYKALDGKKLYTGRLKDHTEDAVTIEDEKGNEITLLRKDAAKINLAVIF